MHRHSFAVNLAAAFVFAGAGVSFAVMQAHWMNGASTAEAVEAAQAARENAALLPTPAPDEGRAGKFIVVFKDEVSDVDLAEENLVSTHGLGKTHSFRNAVRGFSADFPAGKLAKIKADPRVAFVSEDLPVQAEMMPQAGGNAGPKADALVVTQPAQSSPTGIARIGAGKLANKGTGIGVAVIDTGIDLSHPDLAANVVANVNCLNSKKSGQDDNGHGSHVAGTIAALDNAIGVVGVAPEAKLAAVKVLDSAGSGSWSSVICGLDWATANAARYNLKVVNMSLGGSGSSDNNCGNTNNDALHKAICRARNAGLTVVVAAGNSAADAATSVPSAYDDAVITVSALADSDGKPGGLGAATSYGKDDSFASFSNYGAAVDIGAPGVNILSTWLGGKYNTLSGTSMATPHVSGSAALYIKSHPGSTWSQVRDGLRAAGEALNAGHSDTSGKHPEPVVNASAL